MRKLIILSIVVALLLFPGSIAFADADGNSVQIGRESIEDYGGASDLHTATDCVNGLIDIVCDLGSNWGIGITWTDDDVWENDFTENDYRLSDDVDLFSYCGHGLLQWGPYLSDTSHDSQYVDRREIRWGDRDMEWALMFTCNFLTHPVSGSNGIGQMMNGVHMICGFGSVMWVTSNGGSVFAEQAISGSSVATSWAYYAQYTQPPVQNQTVNYVRLYHSSTFYDRLWGYGTVASDPTPYNTSTSGYFKMVGTLYY